MIWKESNERLTFKWIKEKGTEIVMVVEDLNEIAFNKGLFNHKLDQHHQQQIDQLYQEMKEVVEAYYTTTYKTANEKIANFIEEFNANKNDKNQKQFDYKNAYENSQKDKQHAIDQLTKEKDEAVNQVLQEKDEAINQLKQEAEMKENMFLKQIEELKSQIANKDQ